MNIFEYLDELQVDLREKILKKFKRSILIFAPN